ncbi:MAG: DUF5916 domain-containing protein [Vicinamibacterales bacterium]
MTFDRASVLGGVCLTLGALVCGAAAVCAQETEPREAAPHSARTAAFYGPPPPVAPAMVSRGPEGVTIRAVRLDAPLNLDGRLDDALYTTVLPVGGFIQNEPQEGVPATEQTDVWISFDDENVYVSARCWDSEPQNMVVNEMRRDNQGIQNGDNLSVVFDTFYDRRNGVFFQTNPVGALRDQQATDEGNTNPDWNAVWDAKARRDERGWTMEMAIPFKSLRYNGGGSQTWGINMRRVVKWKNETSFLVPLPASYGTSGLFRMSLAASLVGIEVPSQRPTLDVKPYVKGGLITNRSVQPRVNDDVTGDVGFDVKYGLTKGLTADITVNTDFAQVEEDEQQVNLTRFSLQFPEKRDFFLEGQGIFAFGGVRQRAGNTSVTPFVFFSRQIGITSGGEVPIIAGGRVTGRVGDYSLGLLNIETGSSDTAKTDNVNFSVVRLKRDVLRRSAIGIIGTQRPARNGDGFNQVVGADAALAFYQNVAISAYYARSRTPGYSNRDESSYYSRLDYAPDRYGFNLEYLSVGDGFNPEIGFLRRQAFRRSFAQGRFSPRPQSSHRVRKYTFETSLDYITSPSGRLESREWKGNFQTDFSSGDSWSVEGSRFYEWLPAPFAVATGVTVPSGGYAFDEIRLNYTLGQQHMISGSVDVSHGSFYTGDRTSAGYNGRVNLGGVLGIEPRVTINWIDLPEGQFTSKLVSTRVSLMFSPRLALTSLVQYNSSSASLSSNVRLRWEYAPGSDLFVVYSDGRDTSLSGFPTLQNRSLVVKATRLMRW